MANRKKSKNDTIQRQQPVQQRAAGGRRTELQNARVLRAHEEQRARERAAEAYSAQDKMRAEPRRIRQEEKRQHDMNQRREHAGTSVQPKRRSAESKNSPPRPASVPQKKKSSEAQQKILRMPHRFRLNIGLVLFGLIFCYIGFAYVSYARRDQVKFYEVEEGSIVRENSYTGIILRDETVMNSPEGGYLSYYVPEGRKAAKNTRVYSIDESGKLKSYLETHAEELNELSKDNVAEIRKTLSDFSRQYSDVSFQTLYDMDAALNAQVLEYASLNVLSGMEGELQSAGIQFKEYTAGATGMVSYIIDGYEGKTPEEITAADFDQTKYQREIIRSGELVAANAPAYKLITSDNWSIVFPLNEKDIAALAEQSNLKIRLSEQNITTTVPFEITRGADGNSYGVLKLTRYLVQYASSRFIQFEVVTNDVSGLKIPEKSVTTKDFYVIPAAFLNKDDRGNEGFYKDVLSENGTAQQFVVTDIYYKDDEYAYIEAGENQPFKPGDYVSMKDAPDQRYGIGPKKPLEGVYNINKGYTVFKRIERLETSNGYCIVRKNANYSLSVYDHIVLDASTVGDGQLIYR